MGWGPLFDEAITKSGEPLGSVAGPVAAWFVPGRIEVGGKHTDYAGGRSLVCAVERGLAVVAVRRADQLVRIHSVTLANTASFLAGAPAPSTPAWARYPATVARRLRRDFSIRHGADIALASDLPAAAGLSSSSALVVAIYLALAWANRLPSIAPLELAGYLAAIESGRAWGNFPADGGVGTHGGSEDHTAILCSRPGHLGQYAFCPARFEAEVALPADLIFAVASSGVAAVKTGNAAAAYNHLADSCAAIVTNWNQVSGRADATLADALAAAGGTASLLSALGPAAATFAPRIEQFDCESNHLVPALARAFNARDLDGLGEISARSHALASRCLHNQVPQTDFLAHAARRCGAIAASPFGAGFGGAVWALVEHDQAPAFLQAWSRDYHQQFPKCSARSQFFLSRAGPAAHLIEVPTHATSLA